MHIGICQHCGKEKEYKYKSWIKKYCSHKCANNASKDIRKKDRVKLTCKYCNKEFNLLESVVKSREKQAGQIKYCSQKCMGLDKRDRGKVKCKNCGKEFETTRNKFCSIECVNEFRKTSGMMKKDGYWLENGYKVIYLDGNKSIKEHIKVMQDHIGREINKDEVVHHINGNKLDNRIENLKLMERGEHSRLHRKKELSEGKQLFK